MKNKSFFKDVFNVVLLIPKGRVTTYGLIANYLETCTARMVGWAMNASHTSDDKIPAHRVVNRNGELTGKHHFAYPTLMEELLEAEGVTIINGKIQNFKEHLWNPMNELPAL